MQTATIIYLILALLLSVLVAYFQYFYKSISKEKINSLLFVLKSISIFLLMLLLINPSIERTQLIDEKPILSVLVDNSASIKYFEQEKVVEKTVAELKVNNQLNDKFTIEYYRFGKSLNVLDSLSFDTSETNIYNALHDIEGLSKNVISPIILISDGNQTTGSLYPYFETNKNIYPIIIGDTVKHQDVWIERLNVNKYSYLKNRFPIETSIVYNGSESVDTEFRIVHKNKVVFKKRLSFNASKNVHTISTTIASTKEGVQYYTASVQKLNKEKNTTNNQKVFSVEVLNEQTKILILSAINHPDLGALKKINRNQ